MEKVIIKATPPGVPAAASGVPSPQRFLGPDGIRGGVHHPSPVAAFGRRASGWRCLSINLMPLYHGTKGMGRIGRRMSDWKSMASELARVGGQGCGHLMM